VDTHRFKLDQLRDPFLSLGVALTFMNLGFLRHPWKNALASLAVLGIGSSTVAAQVAVTNRFAGLNRIIPDGQVTGIADPHALSFTNTTFWQITNVQLTIRIDGGFNGDLYGYLVHDGGFAVLFNREGRTSGHRQGYSQAGFDITLADGGNDLHFYQAFGFELNDHGQLTGTWAPDGRRVDPAGVNENAEPSAMFSSFNGLNPNGTWTLFLADLDFGEQATLVEWSLSITAVPEPGTIGLACIGGVMWLLCRRRPHRLADGRRDETARPCQGRGCLL
jgi:hypothetical protein